MDIKREAIEKAVYEGLYPEKAFTYEMLVEHQSSTSETKLMWAKVQAVTNQVMGLL